MHLCTAAAACRQRPLVFGPGVGARFGILRAVDHEQTDLATPMTLRLDRPWAAFLYRFSRVQVRIAAEELELPWGTHVVDLPAGGARVKARFRYLGRTCGPAWLDVPAGTTYLEYKAPLSSQVRGHLAPSAERHGVARTVLVGVAVVIIVGALVSGVLAVVDGRL